MKLARVYEYKCKRCGEQFECFDYGLESEDVHYNCGGELVRVYSFAIDRTALKPFNPHFNPNLGRPITSQSQLDSEMRRASDEATQRTGMEHSFATADLRDRDVFAVKDIGVSKAATDPTVHLAPSLAAHKDNPNMTKAIKEVAGG